MNGFGEIETYFKFIDFQNQLKLSLSFIAEIYLVRGSLRKHRTCLHDNKVPEYFEMDPVIPRMHLQ